MKAATMTHLTHSHHSSLWDLLAIFFHLERKFEESIPEKEIASSQDPLSDLQFFESEEELEDYLQSFRD